MLDLIEHMHALEAAPAADLVPAGPISDGIHFGLDEARYHADPAIGSSDLKALYAEPAAYWFGSSLNPAREPSETTPAQLIGQAVHKFVLEGPQAFNGRFERYPEGDDLLRGADDLAAWLKDRGEKPGTTKATRIAAIREACAAHGHPMPRILDVIIQEATAAGRTMLAGDAFDRICAAGGAVLDNPHLAGSFIGGMPEVSVFWTDTVEGEPVRRKARFDYLKPRAVVDLKSTRPRDNVPFVASCRRALAEWNYPTQAAAYLQARSRVAGLVADGAVYGDHDASWLARVVEADAFAFVFVFWASVGAPLTWGGIMSPGNPVLDVGEEYVRRALASFVAARRAHGLAAPWIAPQPLDEIELDHLPRWYGAA